MDKESKRWRKLDDSGGGLFAAVEVLNLKQTGSSVQKT